MRSNAKRVTAPLARPAYRTLEGWALSVLVEEHAVRECPDHGHMQDRTDPDAWNHARQVAHLHPFPGTSGETSVNAIDEVMRSIGDSCPDCE